ncbi:MAG: hypothetical protein IPK01_00710 [Acidobacteria bacterium]|nr:hypothetical protein [Acidobacteriota bacterium]
MKVLQNLCSVRNLSLFDADTTGSLVKPDVALKQIEGEQAVLAIPGQDQETGPIVGGRHGSPVPLAGTSEPTPPIATQPKRFHGTASLDPTRGGRDASQIADEVIAHLSGLLGAKVTVTLEIEAEIANGASDNIVRTVTENSRTLKFTSHGFEQD